MREQWDELHQAAEWVADARALLVTAGAGIGVDSGLPDFRGPDGFWGAYPALGSAGLGFEEIASPASFDVHPDLAWGFYGHRLALYRRTQPHTGFGILRRWAERMPDGYRVFTSNVDGQFERAGFPPELVHACHGSIHALQCTVPCSDRVWDAGDFHPEVDEAACRLLNAPPLCPDCGALARPHVLMFSDHTLIEGPSLASRVRLDAWTRARSEVLVIEVGAGTQIATARFYGERHASRFIRINMRQSGVRGGSRNIGLAGSALDVLSALDALVR